MSVGAFLFHGHALIVVVDSTCMADAALASEVDSVVAAEQLGHQQIIILSLVAG